MNLEFKCEIDGHCVKKITIFTQKQKTYVEILEKRTDFSKKDLGWIPVHFSTYDKYEDGKAKFIGFLASIAYENANDTLDTNRENIFVRGSLPTSINRRIV